MHVLVIMGLLTVGVSALWGAENESALTNAVNVFSVNPSKDQDLIVLLAGLRSVTESIQAAKVTDPASISSYVQSMTPMSDALDKLAKVCAEHMNEERFDQSKSCEWVRKTGTISKIREKGCQSAATAMASFLSSTSGAEILQGAIDIENAMGRAASKLKNRECKAIQDDLDLIRSKEDQRDKVFQSYRLLLRQVENLFSKSASYDSLAACRKQTDSVFNQYDSRLALPDVQAGFDRIHDWSTVVAKFNLACEDLKSKSKKTPYDYEAYCFAMGDLKKWRLEKTKPTPTEKVVSDQVTATTEKCISEVCAAFPNFNEPKDRHGMCFVSPVKSDSTPRETSGGSLDPKPAVIVK